MIRAVLTAVGLLLVLVLAAAVVGLAVAILVVMAIQGVEGKRPVHLPAQAPIPAPDPTRNLLMVPVIRRTRQGRTAPVNPEPGEIPAKGMAKAAKTSKYAPPRVARTTFTGPGEGGP